MSILSGKTILILTAGFGAGHVSAANAIKDSILKDEKCKYSYKKLHRCKCSKAK